MKMSVTVSAFLVCMLLFVLAAMVPSCQFCQCVSERELIFYYHPMIGAHTNALVGTEDVRDCCGVSDAMFHMRSAIKFIGSEKSRRVLVERFLLRHSEYTNRVETVSKAFQGVVAELRAGMLPFVRIRTETSDRDLSRMVVECYADAIIGYFSDENCGLLEKISAWFEGQKAGKGVAEVEKINGQERLAIEKARRKCLQVLKSTNECDTVCGWRWGLPHGHEK